MTNILFETLLKKRHTIGYDCQQYARDSFEMADENARLRAISELSARTAPNLMGDESYKSFRFKLGTLAIALLLITLGVGLFAREQQRNSIGYTIDNYDRSFASRSQIQHAQLVFKRYSEHRVRTDQPAEIELANELLRDAISQIGAAADRSKTGLSGSQATAIKAELEDLTNLPTDQAPPAVQLETIAKDLERLERVTASIEEYARDDIHKNALQSDFLTLLSILTSIMLAGLVLLSLDRLVTSVGRSRAQLSAALESIPQGLCMVDRNQHLLACNSQYAQMYGLDSRHTKLGTPLQTILEHQIASNFCPVDTQDFMRETLAHASDPMLGTKEHQFRDGRIISVTRSPLSIGGSVAIHMDVTERRKMEKENEFLARHDALTGSANRIELHAFIEEQLKQTKQGVNFAVHCLDLDHFKSVNDTLGHTYGDTLLRMATARLRTLMRSTDLIARTGGDEFSIVQTNLAQPEGAAASLAERIIAAINKPFDLGDHQVVVGASVGISIAPTDGTLADEIIKNADLALYQAKAEGRGIYHFFEASMQTKAQERRLLEQDLRNAIAREQFELEYQPIVNLQQNRICGFEALLRWSHPARGRLAPNEFIPLAEETGLIVAIDGWVLQTACKEASTWPDDIRLAVNMSPLQFRNKNIVGTVLSSLEASGLSPNRLEIEITEAVLLHNNEATLEVLHQLRALGLRISMDDFGTGYSSLSYLRSFPFDKLKIDQCFVQDLVTNPDAIAIIRAVAALGVSFKMITTVEGVETQQQLDHVRAEGCTEVQGFAYSRPVEAARVAAVLADFGKLSVAAA